MVVKRSRRRQYVWFRKLDPDNGSEQAPGQRHTVLAAACQGTVVPSAVSSPRDLHGAGTAGQQHLGQLRDDEATEDLASSVPCQVLLQRDYRRTAASSGRLVDESTVQVSAPLSRVEIRGLIQQHKSRQAARPSFVD